MAPVEPDGRGDPVTPLRCATVRRPGPRFDRQLLPHCATGLGHRRMDKWLLARAAPDVVRSPTSRRYAARFRTLTVKSDRS